MDFKKLFNLLPPSLTSLTIFDPPTICDVSNCRVLSSDQQFRLQQIVDIFPSFAKEELGRTNVLCHVIDTGDAKPIKQRHFAVSPAIEKLIYEELDRMISMGVIE